MPSDHKYFNCTEEHESDYVIYTKYERTKDTSPSAQELRDYIEKLCDKHNNMTHKFLYDKIEAKYPELKK